MRLRHCGSISHRKCIRHTPCAARKKRHTECAGYIGSARALVPVLSAAAASLRSSSH